MYIYINTQYIYTCICIYVKGMIAMRKVLDLGKAKRMSTESLMKLAEFVLKNYIFEYNLSF